MVSLNPFMVSFNPFVVSFNPFMVSFNPFVVSFNPFVVSFNPFVVSLSNHGQPALRQAQGERSFFFKTYILNDFEYKQDLPCH